MSSTRRPWGVRARHGQDPGLRDEVERIRPIALGLERLPGEAWDPPAAPPLSLPREPRPAQDEMAAGGGRVRGRPRLIGVVIGTLLDDGRRAGRLRAPDRARARRRRGGAQGSVEIPRDEGTPLTVSVSGLEPAGSGDFYELWLLGSDGELIALGSFTVGADGTASESLPLPVDPAGFQYFDLSLEPADGDPGHSGRAARPRDFLDGAPTQQKKAAGRKGGKATAKKS